MEAEATASRAHVVLVPIPAQGHLPAIVHLATELAAHGCVVTVVNFSSLHSTLMRKWICPEGLDIRLEQLDDLGWHLAHGVSSQDVSGSDVPSHWKQGMARMEPLFIEFLSQLHPRPCCVLRDYFHSWRVPTGFLSAIYFPASVAYSCIHHHLDLLIRNGAVQRGSPPDDTTIDYIPGIKELEVDDLPDYLQWEGGPFMFGESFDRMKDCDWILVNSIEDLEPEAFQAMRKVLNNKNFVPVAPLMHLDSTSPRAGILRDEDDSCIRWLDTQKAQSVLYISFGSIAALSDKQLEELAYGLELSRQPFLWVLREQQNLTGLEEFQQRTQGRGRIVGWVPQLQVLAHSSTGGFLSHCGWNSVLESICSGVPILGWPCANDQFLNSTWLAKLGLGKRLSSKLERSAIRDIIGEFMEGQDMAETRLKCKHFSTAARNAAARGGSSQNNFRSFVRALNEHTP